MARKKVKSKINVSAMLQEALREYHGTVNADVSKVVKEIADEAVQEIRRAANLGGTGGYLESIHAEKQTDEKSYRTAYVIRADEYRLTHLLENGHDIVKKGIKVGQAQAFPHWAAGRKYIAEKLPQRIAELIERGS